MKKYDIIIVGGGLSGMTAAISASEKGAGEILILEREDYLGGILVQCIHNGFGENLMDETLTGPEFAEYFIEKIKSLNIDYKLNTMVLDINNNKVVTAVSSEEGIVEYKASAIILATGCREKYNGNINVPMHKYAGIYTVGSAHKFINFQGYIPGKNVVILGSSDIAIIVARRLIIEGAKVKAIVENQPYINSQRKSIVRCIDEFNIPLRLGYSVTEVIGDERVKAVIISKIDENGRALNDTEEKVDCDCLLLSVGWMPESDLPQKARIKISSSTGGPLVDKSYETSQSGIFACGNLIHIYSWAEDAAKEGYRAGENAVKYLLNYIKV